MFWDRLFGPRTAGPVPDATPPAEPRRSSEGQPIGRKLFCEVITLPVRQPAIVVLRDISSTGIGLLCQRRVEEDTFLALKIFQREGEARLIRARVVQVSRFGKDWLLGCTTAAPLSGEDRAALLSGRVPPVGADMPIPDC
jgi:hypothetical protein